MSVFQQAGDQHDVCWSCIRTSGLVYIVKT